MSKTLTLKKDSVVEEPAAVQAFTEEQLRAMLRDLQVKNGTIPVDPTMDTPTGAIPSSLLADKSALPPAGDRSSAPAPQLPAKAHGAFGINGIPLLVPQLGDPNVNPATGAFYTQVGARPQTQISPPPSRRFDGR